MSLTSGFYDSINGDRRYNAEQLSALFNGIINDGVFATIGDAFKVTPVGGNNVTVGSGRAWFNSIWVNNDGLYPLTFEESETYLDRIDAIVIVINKSQSKRQSTIEIVKGTPSANPERPRLQTVEGTKYQYPIAYVKRNAGSASVQQQMITYVVGQESCPFVTGILETVSIDAIVAQWQSEFAEWFDNLQDVLDSNTETKLVNQMAEIQSICNTPEFRRNNFRGRLLGTAPTAEQLAAIQNGTFDDMWLGDYWDDGSNVWRIVDFDYWYNTGDTAFARHHAVIMPDVPVIDGSMESSNATTNGYAGCAARSGKSAATGFASQCTQAFQNMILSHREYLTNLVAAGYPSAGAWYSTDVELPNEIMMFGCHVFAPASNGSIDVTRYTVSKTQLALFRVCPKFIVCDVDGLRFDYWLRDVANIARFAFVSKNGEASYGNASSRKYFRPVFAIG